MTRLINPLKRYSEYFFVQFIFICMNLFIFCQLVDELIREATIMMIFCIDESFRKFYFFFIFYCHMLLVGLYIFSFKEFQLRNRIERIKSRCLLVVGVQRTLTIYIYVYFFFSICCQRKNMAFFEESEFIMIRNSFSLSLFVQSNRIHIYYFLFNINNSNSQLTKKYI